MSSKFNTSIYSETLSWCSVHEPIVVSEFFNQKNKFLSIYSKPHRKIAEIEIIHQIQTFDAGCDTFRYFLKVFNTSSLSDKLHSDISSRIHK